MRARQLLRYFSTQHYELKKQLAVNQDTLINTVLGVNQYKKFLPYCIDSSILNETKEEFEASLTISFKFYELSYVSKVQHFKKDDLYIIKQESHSDIFRVLKGEWAIKQIDDQNCQFYYQIDFEFQNALYQSVSSYFLNIVGEQMVDVFSKQAQKKQFVINKKKKYEDCHKIVDQQFQKNSHKLCDSLQSNKQSVEESLKQLQDDKLIQEDEYKTLLTLYKSSYQKKINYGHNFYMQNDHVHNKNNKFTHFLQDILREHQMTNN